MSHDSSSNRQQQAYYVAGTILTMPDLALEEAVRRIRQSMVAHRPVAPPFVVLSGAGSSSPVIPTTAFLVQSLIEWEFRGFAESNGLSTECTLKNEHFVRHLTILSNLWNQNHEANLESDFLPLWKDSGGQRPCLVEHYEWLLTRDRMGNLQSADNCRAFFIDLIRTRWKRNTIGNPALADLLACQFSGGFPNPIIRGILTTNFDPLIEDACGVARVPYYSDSYVSGFRGLEHVNHGGVFIYHSHGKLNDYWLLNKSSELGISDDSRRTRLQEYLRPCQIIMVGYSGWNDAIVEALLSMRTYGHPIYWVDPRRPEPAFSKICATHPNTYHIAASADQFWLSILGSVLRRELPLCLSDPGRWWISPNGEVSASGLSSEQYLKVKQSCSRNGIFLSHHRDSAHHGDRAMTTGRFQLASKAGLSAVAILESALLEIQFNPESSTERLDLLCNSSDVPVAVGNIARITLANRLAKAKLPDGAEHYLRPILQSNSTSHPLAILLAHHCMAVASFKVGDFAQARSHLHWVVRHDHDNKRQLDARLGLALCETEALRLMPAIVRIRQALEHRPLGKQDVVRLAAIRARLQYKLHLYDRCIDVSTTALKSEALQESEARRFQLLIAMSRVQKEEATSEDVALLENSLVSGFPSSWEMSDIALCLAQGLALQGRQDDAVRTYNKIIRSTQGGAAIRAEAAFLLGKLLLANGNRNAGERIWEEAAESFIDTEHGVMAAINLAGVLGARGNAPGAEALLALALQSTAANPMDRAMARTQISRIRIHLGDRQESIKQLQSILSDLQVPVEMRVASANDLAEMYLKIDQPEDALKICRQLFSQGSPQSPLLARTKAIRNHAESKLELPLTDDITAIYSESEPGNASVLDSFEWSRAGHTLSSVNQASQSKQYRQLEELFTMLENGLPI